MMDQAENLRKLAIQNTESKSRPKIITIASGKGGVGKSNFTVNLGICLSKLNKRVAILDADIGMSNIDILMGEPTNKTICDVVYKDIDIEDIIIDTKYGIKLIPGGSALNHIEDFNEIQRSKFLNEIEKIKDIDYLLIDTGAGINKSLLAFISCSNEFFVITTPEPTSITDAYSLLKATSNLNIKDRASIVINRCNNVKEANSVYLRIKSVADKFLNMNLEFGGYILDDKKVSICVKNQIPFLAAYPNIEISKCVMSIAKNISKDEVTETTEVKTLFKKVLDLFS
jgi:flagellar biosynthesis protein FlhG